MKRFRERKLQEKGLAPPKTPENKEMCVSLNFLVVTKKQWLRSKAAKDEVRVEGPTSRRI